MQRCPRFVISFCLILAFGLSISLYATPSIFAQSGSLYNLSDVLDNDIEAQPAYHSLTFTLPATAQQVLSTDYIQINLPQFTNVTPPTRVVGSFTGTPVYSVSDKTARVTGINILPGRTVTIEGLTANNALFKYQYIVVVSITEDQNGLLVKNTATTVAVRHGGTIKMTAGVSNPQARLDIQGYTSPLAYLIFTEDGTVRGTHVANALGYFLKIFSSLPPGDHRISFYAIDDLNRSTSIRTIDINTPVYLTTAITNQLLSPTLEINANSFLQSQPLTANGSAYPGTAITLFTDTPVRTYSASASATGNWTYTIPSLEAYTPGDYRIYAMAQTQAGLQSLISPTILFTVTDPSGGGGGTPCGEISHGDLNCDNLIDLTDFSVLMYYWGTVDPTADINADSLVDLTDLSIMMYYWGT